MDNITCRNCGNENIYLSRINDKVDHYDCLDCNYQWSAPSVKSKQIIANITFGFIGLLFIIFSALPAVWSAHSVAKINMHMILFFTGAFLVSFFSYRYFRLFRLIKK